MNRGNPAAGFPQSPSAPREGAADGRSAYLTTFVTLPLRRQRVQTFNRFEPPGVAVRTDLRFGRNRRLETL